MTTTTVDERIKPVASLAALERIADDLGKSVVVTAAGAEVRDEFTIGWDWTGSSWQLETAHVTVYTFTHVHTPLPRTAKQLDATSVMATCECGKQIERRWFTAAGREHETAWFV